MAGDLDFGTIPSLWHRYEVMPRRLGFRAKSRAEWAAWREALRAQLVELLGGFPIEHPALDTKLLETGEEADCRLEKVAFRSDRESFIPCYVLTPRHEAPPYRPVIALHGHGIGGAAHTVGLTVRQASDADQKICISKQNLDYGRRLAQHGFMVFAPEQRGFGQRIDSIPDITVENTPGHNSCRALAFNAMLLGKTAIGLRVWDVMRTIDYIRSRQEPMIEEIGCLGFSGGGTTTLFASALDLRITVAVVSGYFNTFHASIMSHYHCECNYIPSILQYAEMSDIAGLIAPRFLLIESGVDDPIYPVEAAEAAFHELQRVYALLKVSNRLEHEVFPGGHQFGGNRCFAWLDEWLE